MTEKELSNYLLKYKEKTINIILDTSGSIYGISNKVLNLLHDSTKYFLFQVDYEICKVDFINTKSKLNRINIPIGASGSMINPSLQSISKRNKLPIIIITDGFIDKLDFSNIYNQTDIIIVDIKLSNEYLYYQSVKKEAIDGEKIKENYLIFN